ncbi:MAG: EamA family transporter [Desulfobacterales bacterium]|nr:MAG: EamA family transporter [Desulfobacterales bacterium]
MDVKTALGCLAVFGSAFFFYLSTVVIKWSSIAGLDIESSMFTLARFLLGVITVVIVMAIRRQRIRIVKKRYLLGRALGNALAVFCFFKGVEMTSVAQANILNMTYPIFIALFSWIFLKSQRDKVALVVVGVALSGVWLILSPGRMTFDHHSLWALASGFIASIAILCLNLARKDHDSQTILFVMFTLGGAVVFILFFDEMRLPKPEECAYLMSCSVIAIVGQYLLTVGFKYVTAVEGSILSSSRILLAAILGPVIAMDPVLPLSGWVGACLIFGANVLLTLRKARR